MRHLSSVTQSQASIAMISEVQQDLRFQWFEQVRYSGMWTAVPRDWARRLLLPRNSSDHAASLPQHITDITPEVPKNPCRTFFCSWYSMRLYQTVFALASFAAACEAFRFTVWLGDKCTISGTGTKPSDQELLVIPQNVGSAGCMV